MRWWDVERAHQIDQQVFESTAWTAEMFWGELAGVPESRYYLVATGGASVVGYAGARMVGADADVQTLAVAPENRHQGIGKQLLDALTTQASAHGCTRLYLEVGANNHAAQDLYTGSGFEVQARRSNYYGPGTDALVMRLPLHRPPTP